MHVLTAGDLDARYLGSRATLEPLFASYAMPANSDYAPVLDLNAARHRFMERSASDVVALLNAELPLLELIERDRSQRAVNPCSAARTPSSAWRTRGSRGTRATSCCGRARPCRVGTARAAEGSRARQAAPDRVPRAARARRLAAQRAARGQGAQSLPRADDLAPIWTRIMGSACYGDLEEFQQRWLALFQAVGARNPARMAELAAPLMATEKAAGRGRARVPAARRDDRLRRERRQPQSARAMEESMGGRAPARPAFRLLRCHAEPSSCAEAFRAYAER